MPETTNGVTVQPEFSKPPSATTEEEGLKQATHDIKGKINAAAEALGGTASEIGKHPDPGIQTQSAEDPELINVSIEDRRDFLRTLLSGQPFVKQYGLFNDNVVITFRTRTTDENKDIKLAVKSGKYTVEALRMVRSTVNYSFAGKGVITDEFGSLSDILYTALLKEFRKFEDLCDLLFTKADDPNFWKEIGGRS